MKLRKIMAAVTSAALMLGNLSAQASFFASSAAVVENVSGYALEAPDEIPDIISAGMCGESVYWKLDNNGLLTIYGKGDMTNYRLSNTPNAPSWYNDKWYIKNIVIEDGVTSIGNYAFSYCFTVESITIPDGVTSIGIEAFSDCSRLKSITIPNSVTTIENAAFEYCSSLESIKIPDSVTVIGANMFRSCSALKSITIPKSVTTIGDSAFKYCSSLETVTIPSSVTRISGYAFYNCTALKSIKIPDTTTYLGGSVFYRCTSLKSITLSNNIATIYSDTFAYCESLKSIKIPKSVTRICTGAFHYCTSLESITIPDGVTCIDFDTFSYCKSLKSVKIPDSVTVIEMYSFSNCISLESVTIPENVEIIWESAFSNCISLESIRINSPNCYICERYDTIYPGATIYGYPDSSAQSYAERFGLSFISFDGSVVIEPTTTSTITTGNPDTDLFYTSTVNTWNTTYTYNTDTTTTTTEVFTTTTYVFWIKEEPKDAVVLRAGDTGKITFTATGDGLTYTWYYRNPGQTKFSKTSCTSSTYSLPVTQERNGREMYCVVTDSWGDSLQTRTVKMRITEPEIITQPVDGLVSHAGDKGIISVEADGYKLSYLWYYKNPGQTKFSKTSCTSSTYSLPVTLERNGREMYCVITDGVGNSIKTNTVKMGICPDIYNQSPEEVIVNQSGAKAKIFVKADGENLTYLWYFKNPGQTKFTASSVKTSTYSIDVTKERNGRQMYCVVTDKYGNTTQSNIMTLTIQNAEIVSQPKNVTVAHAGDKAVLSVNAIGSNLSYKWYYKNPGQTKFYEASSTSATYSLPVTEARSGREMYCVITDDLGNSVQSDTVAMTISIKMTANLSTKYYYNDGQKAVLQFAVDGDDVNYVWYFMNPDQYKFSASSVNSNTYSIVMTEDRNGRQMYCVATDKYGNSITSKTSTIYIC